MLHAPYREKCRLAMSVALLLTVAALPQARAQDRQNHADQKLNLALIAPAQATAKFDAAFTAQTVAPFVDDETIAVAHADVSRISPVPIVAALARLVPDAAFEFSEAEKGLAGCLAALRRERVSDLYFVVSLGGRSMVPRMSLFLFPAEPKRNLEKLRSELQLPSFVNLGTANLPSPAAGPPARPELAEALAAAGDAAAQVVLMPPASSRRVIEELMPQLPSQIGGGSSTILTHGIRWAAAAIQLSPEFGMRLTVKSQDAAAAEALRAKWLDMLKLAGEQKEVRELVPNFNKATAMLSPELSRDRLTLALTEKDAAAAGVLVPLQRAIEKAQEAEQRAQSMNKIKNIGLGFCNFIDAAKHFPPPTSHAPDGKPLLSWRVAILPYIEEEGLYKQFHLDEPWDSPHNKALVEKMPALFRSPKSKAAKGMTNYVVPVGGGALYSSAKDEPTFKDIADGTSHTIMLVEVDDAHAVVWTKPDDMTFDPQDPKKGIGSLYEQGFNVALCDGSVHFIPKSIDPSTLKALLTRAGKEGIDFSKF